MHAHLDEWMQLCEDCTLDESDSTVSVPLQLCLISCHLHAYWSAAFVPTSLQLNEIHGARATLTSHHDPVTNVFGADLFSISLAQASAAMARLWPPLVRVRRLPFEPANLESAVRNRVQGANQIKPPH